MKIKKLKSERKKISNNFYENAFKKKKGIPLQKT